ncbi:MAG: hypothetical protein CUN56_04845 [Phototrophicales bacterium]|nr:MAG: hypothetical protein CUN56_04845 [Phototrophicales bacterium]RMG75966.1 MAG: hypothetical protein D6711_05215 [Chloroflexota bacterium]
MPAYIRILTPQGLQPVDYTADSLADAATYEPDGVYTVTNTYNRYQVLKFEAHLDRLQDSARRAKIDLTLNRPALKAALRQMITDADMGDVRFRITVPRHQPEYIIITLEPFQPVPPQIQETGVAVITIPNSARHNPNTKSTDWMQTRRKITLPGAAYEAILLNADGYILEGLSSNFYAIIHNELRTAGEGVLPGIAQQIVFEIAPNILPIRKDAPHIRELPDIQEAFITSSSRGIVPIHTIDNHSLGKPGEKTRALIAAYNTWVKSHLETL